MNDNSFPIGRIYFLQFVKTEIYFIIYSEMRIRTESFNSSTIMPILIMQRIQTYSKLLSYPLSPSSDQPKYTGIAYTVSPTTINFIFR